MRGIEESMKNGHMLRQDIHEITLYIPLQVTVIISCKTTVFFSRFSFSLDYIQDGHITSMICVSCYEVLRYIFRFRDDKSGFPLT